MLTIPGSFSNETTQVSLDCEDCLGEIEMRLDAIANCARIARSLASDLLLLKAMSSQGLGIVGS